MRNFKQIRKDKKEIEKAIKNYEDSIKENLEKDNESRILTLDLSEGDIYKEYTSKKMLNSNIFEYIDDFFNLNRKNDFKLRIIYPVDMLEDEKSEIKNLIKAHYALSYQEANKAIKRNRLGAILSLITGCLFLMGYLLLLYFNVNYIFSEILDIFAWVFIWESCDLLFFSVLNQNLTKVKCLKLFNMEII